MEDSFKVRVDKVFGSLGGYTPSSASVNPSLWSLTDEEVEKREWNRHKEEEDEEGDDGVESELPLVEKQMDSDLENLSGDEGDEEEAEEIDGDTGKRRRDTGTSAETSDDEYLDVQSNIGRDCTLDYEEEEDEYDKVAVGDERNGDRLYMKDVKFADYGIDDVTECGELPNTFRAVVKDPRANHEAAKIRLKEDAEAAGNFDNLQLSDNSNAINTKIEDLKKGEESERDNPKPILKKKENLMDSRSHKRVRFNVDPETSFQAHDDQPSSGAVDLSSEPQSRDDNILEPEQGSEICQYSSRVPDYLRNPSKYTRYTFDSSDDMDDQSNRKAYMDLFNFLRKRNNTDDKTSVEIPKSIVFSKPKRKSEDDSMGNRSETERNTGDNVNNKSWSIGVTVEESEVSAMDEGEPVDEELTLQKSGRQYRARTNVDVDDDIN